MTVRRRCPSIAMLVAGLILPAAAIAANAAEPPDPFAPRDIGDVTVLDIPLADGIDIRGRLCLPPANGGAAPAPPVRTLVIQVHGTGPGTYLTRRRLGPGRILDCSDVHAEAFTARGIGFFSYNKRGVGNGDEPPWFDTVDRDVFRTAVPTTEADDIAEMVRTLRRHERLAGARIMLHGVSEGTIVAALAAERHPDLVDALLLTGYCHENMYDVIAHQFQGHGSMLTLRPVFDADDDGVISRPEYESGEERPSRYRDAVMRGAGFELLDATGDEVLTADDFALRQKVVHEMLLHCVATGNEDWIWNNYFRVSVEWLRAHFALEPNKTRLLRLDLPIHVLHGADDAHVPADSVRDLQARFRASGRTNLDAHVFEGHDHDLDFMEWVRSGEPPEGIRRLLEIVERFDAAR